jgi:hypothetical protein
MIRFMRFSCILVRFAPIIPHGVLLLTIDNRGTYFVTSLQKNSLGALDSAP